MNDKTNSNQISWKGTHQGRDWEASVSKLKGGKYFARKVWLLIDGKRQMGTERGADVHESEGACRQAIEKFVADQKLNASFK